MLLLVGGYNTEELEMLMEGLDKLDGLVGRSVELIPSERRLPLLCLFCCRRNSLLESSSIVLEGEVFGLLPLMEPLLVDSLSSSGVLLKLLDLSME